MIRTSQIITLLLALLAASVSFGVCELPADLDAKIPDRLRTSCLEQSYFLVDPPENLNEAEILKGPNIKDITFRSDETVHCRYFYRTQNGASKKFRCYRTTADNILYDDKGNAVPEAKSVGAFQKADEDVLYDQYGKALINSKGKKMKADVLKVRFQDATPRHRENFTSIVAGKMAWLMGVPSEYNYSTQQVICFGCERNPFAQRKPAPKKVQAFPFASIERKFNGKRIIKAIEVGPVRTLPWTWAEFTNNSLRLNEDQKLEFSVLALYANLLHILEKRGTQHMLVCEKKYLSEDEKQCSKPLAAIHDIGAAFGNRDQIDPRTDNHPRGDYRAYSSVRVFKGKNCKLTLPAGRLTHISEEARQLFVDRLKPLDFKTLRLLVAQARFEYMDLDMREYVAKREHLQGEALNSRIHHLWAALILSKIEEIRNTRCY